MELFILASLWWGQDFLIPLNAELFFGAAGRVRTEGFTTGGGFG